MLQPVFFDASINFMRGVFPTASLKPWRTVMIGHFLGGWTIDVRLPRQGTGIKRGSVGSILRCFSASRVPLSAYFNVAGAIRMAKELGPGHTIVTILCDSGTRYQSKLFNVAFLKEKGLPYPDWLA